MVDIELRGVPKGVQDGGILEQFLNEIEVECLALAIPEALHPLVNELGLDESLFVKDLVFPDGVTVLTDAEARVATIRVQVEEEAAEDEAEADPEASGSEPQRIGRVRPEDEAKGKV